MGKAPAGSSKRRGGSWEGRHDNGLPSKEREGGHAGGKHCPSTARRQREGAVRLPPRPAARGVRPGATAEALAPPPPEVTGYTGGNARGEPKSSAAEDACLQAEPHVLSCVEFSHLHQLNGDSTTC